MSGTFLLAVLSSLLIQTVAIQISNTDAHIAGPMGSLFWRNKTMQSFSHFIQKYGRQYTFGSAEYQQRQALFMKHVAAVIMHNSKPGIRKYVAGVNHLADRTEAELASLRGYRKHAHPGGSMSGGHEAAAVQIQIGAVRTRTAHKDPTPHEQQALPASVSYGHLDAIKESRTQGSCGSCWAFASETVMRAHAEINHSPITKFSTAQLTACTPNPQHCGGEGGCQGATSELAFEYAMIHGLKTEKEYGYDASHMNHCPKDSTDSHTIASLSEITSDGSDRHVTNDAKFHGRDIGMIGWMKFPENKEGPIVQYLAHSGPIAVAVAADYNWNLYESGIMHQDPVADWVINHAVVLFGYGTTSDGTNYWHIKNSWGNGWGEQGNLRVERKNEESWCGTDKDPKLGTGCDGGPPEVHVCGNVGVLYDCSVPIWDATTVKQHKRHR